jgi:NAD(P)-dependent dehydrogenase (short-subunit alcohol dehydrogenase family)
MQIEGSTALVTGANRGLGRRFAEELVARGAKVYAGARNPDAVDVPGVKPVRLDVTDPASVAAAAEATGDVNLLINNAGSSTGANLLTGSLEDIKLELDTHYFGTLAVTRAFAPQLAAAGGGAVLNVLSVLSWITFPDVGAYSAAKSAEWALTNALRVELRGQDTLVVGVHAGWIDTEMAATVEDSKISPREVAAQTLDAVEKGRPEVLTDDWTRQVKDSVATDQDSLYPDIQRSWDAGESPWKG